MTSLNTQLWELISNYKMPDDASGISFAEQLMAENRTSHDTADVAITEYRKYMYLCATRAERNVPSKAVDLVWHLHMQHSRDYWDGFCKTLGKQVHHTPGGQGSQHLEDYKATLEAYKDLFGRPPKGIWKQNSKVGAFFTLIFLTVFIFFSSNAIAQGENTLLGILFLAIPLYTIVTTLNSLTTKGEFTLIFGGNDPFADDDAGDCGSGDGDGGGWGD